MTEQSVAIATLLSDNPEGWFTNRDLYGRFPEWSRRSIRSHTAKLAEAGLLDARWVFPELRYRWAVSPNRAAVAGLESARGSV